MTCFIESFQIVRILISFETLTCSTVPAERWIANVWTGIAEMRHEMIAIVWLLAPNLQFAFLDDAPPVDHLWWRDDDDDDVWSVGKVSRVIRCGVMFQCQRVNWFTNWIKRRSIKADDWSNQITISLLLSRSLTGRQSRRLFPLMPTEPCWIFIKLRNVIWVKVFFCQ